jgi:hypothetical protein
VPLPLPLPPSLSFLQVKSYRAPAFLATHYVNAFESPDGRLLHLDCAVTDGPGLMTHWDLKTGACWVAGWAKVC